jgi:serine/threonine protein kinase
MPFFQDHDLVIGKIVAYLGGPETYYVKTFESLLKPVALSTIQICKICMRDRQRPVQIMEWQSKLCFVKHRSTKPTTWLDSDQLDYELQATFGLPSHPHVVIPIGVAVQLDTRDSRHHFVPTFLVYPFIAQHNLACYHPFESISLLCRLSIVTQLASAMDHLHSHNIVHHDMSLENVVIRGDPHSSMVVCTATLIDLGLAEKFSTGCDTLSPAKLENDRRRLGTHGYRAPEQDCQTLCVPVTQKIDIYGFGVICYYLLEQTSEAPLTTSIHEFIGRCRDYDPSCRPSALEAFDFFSKAFVTLSNTFHHTT